MDIAFFPHNVIMFTAIYNGDLQCLYKNETNFMLELIYLRS